MTKFAIPISEQIEKFKFRGLNLDCYNEAKLKEILLDIGYYRIGFYCHPFINEANDKFNQNIKISDVVIYRVAEKYGHLYQL